MENVTVLLTHGSDGWQIAGVADWLPRPGWPPVIERIVDPTD